MDDLVGYEVLLPFIAAAIRGKNKNDRMLGEAEFKAVVKAVFVQSVVQFAQDSNRLQEEIPIDVYAGVSRYPIMPPKGFRILKIEDILAGALKVPKALKTQDKNLYITPCTDCDVDKAWWARVSLVPSISAHNCQVPSAFIDDNYTALTSLMFYNLYMEERRAWADLGRADRYRREYRKELNQLRRNEITADGPITLRSRRLTDGTS